MGETKEAEDFSILMTQQFYFKAYILEKTLSHATGDTQMFVAVLFIVVNNVKQPKYTSLKG